MSQRPSRNAGFHGFASGVQLHWRLFSFRRGYSARQAVFRSASRRTAIVVLSGYSIFYLLLTKQRRRVAKQYVYLLTFFDVAVITAILCSSLTPCPATDETAGIVFGAYFIAIAFTAFHYRTTLSIFSGVISVAGYTTFSLAQFALCQDMYPSLFGYCTKTALLLFAAWLSAVVSRNNYQTVRKVLSSELRYDTLADRLPEMIFTMDAEGNFVWSNKGCIELLGISPEKLVGTNIRSFFTKPEMFKPELRGVKKTLEIRDQNGKIKHVDCTIQKVARGAAAEAYDGLMTDVTDGKWLWHSAKRWQTGCSSTRKWSQ